MNVSKFLITSASALAIVGTVGFAVAQTGTTSSDTVTNPTTDATVNMQAAPMPAPEVMPASPETSMTTEREPQADRN